MLNACVSRYLRFTVPGTHTHLLGVDGGHEASPEQVSEVFLAPGNRADLTVDIMPGADEVRTLEHQRSSMGGNPGGRQRGNRGRRGGGPMTHEMGFDGLSFDAERVDQHVTVGMVEAWRIHNPTMFDHPFHLHVWPMQVVEENGAPVTQVRWRDVVNVTPGGSVRVLIDFSGHDGLTVYHCHILDHEDAGMMGVIEVAQEPSS